MKTRSLLTFAALAAAVTLTLVGCSAPTAGSTSAAAPTSKRACVILPDTDSSNRWENGDRPALTAAFKKAGFTTDIQNAENDTAKYATIAEQQLSKGCGVYLLVDLQGAGIQVTKNAQKQGIPVIAYDRPIAGADFYVSFDNEAVGELQGTALVAALKAEGKDPATAKVVYSGGDPADGNAGKFHDGANKVMTAAGIKPVFETAGTWDPVKAGTAFEQAYTALQGNIDAVWVANDNNAASVIAILDKNGKKIPVTGQDASPAGLQNVLLGKQSVTIYKPFRLEAQTATDVAVQLLKGKTPKYSQKNDGVPFIALKAIPITAATVETVVAAGDAKASAICTADVQAACDKNGVK